MKRIKEVVISYNMHFPYLKQMLNSWTTENRIFLQDSKDLITAILKVGPQFQWKTLCKKEVSAREHRNSIRDFNIFQDQLLGKDQCAELQRICK